MPTDDFAGYFKKFIFFSLLLSLVVSRGSVVASADDWLEGANGYARGKEQSVSAQKPMMVYFYTDWCGYCRKFEKHTLANPDVQKALSVFVKVRINPEKGDRENQLSEQYQIDGFPSVYFENPASGQATQEMTRALRSAKDFINAANEFSKVSQASKIKKKPVVADKARSANKASAFAAVEPEQIIHLKSGRKAEGKVISEDDKGITLATSDLGEIYFSRSEIQKIEKIKK